MITFAPSDSPFPRPGQEPYIDSPLPEAIQVAERLRAGAEEQVSDFTPLIRFMATLMQSGHRLIDSPADANPAGAQISTIGTANMLIQATLVTAQIGGYFSRARELGGIQSVT